MLSKLMGMIRVSLLVLLSVSTLSADEYELTFIPELPVPLGTNDDGTILVGQDFNNMAVVWSAETGATVIGEGAAWGVSDDGKVVASLINNDGLEEAAIWQNGEITWLGNIPGGSVCDTFISSGLAISADGTTVTGMGWHDDWSAEAYYWTAETGMVALGQDYGASSKAQAVSGDGSIIGGWNENDMGWRCSVIWDKDGNRTYIGSPSGGLDGEVGHISSNGTAYGFGSGSGEYELTSWMWTQEGGMTDLSGPDCPSYVKQCWALSGSDNGTAVGNYFYNGFMDFRSCIRTEETGTMTDLKTYLIDHGMQNIDAWSFNRAMVINNAGTHIAGLGINDMGDMGGYLLKLANVGVPNGYISGTVTIDETFGMISDVVLKLGSQYIHPSNDGTFTFESSVGTFTLKASLYGYNQFVETGIVVNPELTTTINVNLDLCEEPLNIPRNLIVDTEIGKIDWDAALEGYSSFAGWNDGVCIDGMGMGEAGTTKVAIRFDTESLMNYSGGFLKGVRFFPKSNVSTYTVKVWVGADAANEIASIPVQNFVNNQWNYVDLDELIEINAMDELWIGYEANSPEQTYPFGHDDGPAIAGYGDMLYYYGAWNSLASFGFDANLCIDGLIVDPQGKALVMKRPEKRIEKASSDIEYPETKIASGNIPSDNKEYTGYNVYLNNYANPVASNISETEYTFEGLEPNTQYYAAIETQYASGEVSEMVMIDFIYQKEADYLEPANLAFEQSTKTLTWDMPGMWLGFESGVCSEGIGLNDGGEFAAAIRLSSEMLADYEMSHLTSMKFIAKDVSVDFTLKVWKGEEAEELVYEQEIENVILDSYTIVTLDEPVVINANETVWIGYQISNQAVGVYPAGVDEGPAIANCGDMLWTQNEGWTELADWGVNKNWNLQAYIEADGNMIKLNKSGIATSEDKEVKNSILSTGNVNESKDQIVTCYNVSLDGNIIATVTDRSYVFGDLTNGVHTAGVVAVYADGQSEMSTLEFNYTVGIESSLPNNWNLSQNYPNPFNPETTINFSVVDGFVGKVSLNVYNSKGEFVQELVRNNLKSGNYSVTFNASSMSSGIYYCIMNAGNYTKSVKMVLIK
ncbi:MAG: T9SS type A sorting domain-containing protein [Candidatus Delongbacteria bacterium]|nr:T9SS type A sorting domain-containing protein [Candidatus Delongbacteria bacterium]MBN2835104.1 T9SS type A sorting domain-containing protein [Candidatus Delongbacteria bacterium]